MAVALEIAAEDDDNDDECGFLRRERSVFCAFLAKDPNRSTLVPTAIGASSISLFGPRGPRDLRGNGSHLNRKCSKVSKNLHQPPDATCPVAAAAAAAHSPLETVPPLFHYSKPATARTTAVTGPDLAPGAHDPAQLIAEAADLARTHVDRDPVQPYEPLHDPVRLARAPE
ncbi:hypothetical protein HPB50_028991 [Hyalomma asiaticum]|nr:hypothetical protein HPB50_028991 [Hyalomma asiaticum]